LRKVPIEEGGKIDIVEKEKSISQAP
jgi:hypothetical protein